MPSACRVRRPSMPGDDGEKIADKASQIIQMMQQLNGATEKRQPESSSKIAGKERKEHAFWRTQPVPQNDLSSLASVEHSAGPNVLEDEQGRAAPLEPKGRKEPSSHRAAASLPVNGPISRDCDVGSVKQDAYALPEGFEWCILDINSVDERQELYRLLNENYVEDVDSCFRFDYPQEFLEWALMPPGWKREWHLTVRASSSRRMVAFISAIPCTLSIRGATVEGVEVNFLCIHKKLRSRRLAPMLIREVTRRVNLHGIFQALYTAGSALPGILSASQYYHRPINFEKLVEAGFTAIPLTRTLAQMNAHYALPKEARMGAKSFFRPMTRSDVPSVARLFESFSRPFTLHAQLNEEEIAHWILPRDEIIYSFVSGTAEDREEDRITDFISFYSLPSTIVEKSGTASLHKSLKVAYLFYYAAESKDRLKVLVEAALVRARDLGFDVFNCVDIMQNSVFLDDLKFGEGDGTLHYYLYNWQTAPLTPSETAIVML